ncbi:MAG: hypothetical protein M1834_001841 [Cirrosporium novae-zelandiae]|nr:MAG: hypothetical protein M1834_001841 [Cirrosporium novae-zelandiae]
MGLKLPNDLVLNPLKERFPGRELQIQQLAYLFNPNLPSPPTTVLYGLEATGKSIIVREVLETIRTCHAIVKSRECITVRHLLEKTFTLAREVVRGNDNGRLGRCDSVSALLVNLQELLRDKQDEKLVLVFDDVDGQRDAPGTLLPGLARFGEIVGSIHHFLPRGNAQENHSSLTRALLIQISNLSVILIVQNPSSRFLHLTGVPHISFPPYTRVECTRILSLDPLRLPSLQKPDHQEEDTTSTSSAEPISTITISSEDATWLWSQFVAAVWDALAKDIARDLLSFRSLCERLWAPFAQPVLDGTLGPREFSKLLVRNRSLFQGEAALVDKIIPATAGDGQRKGYTSTVKSTHTLPYFTTYLLLSAYLASHNPARTDELYFAKYTHSRKRRRRMTNPSSTLRKSKKTTDPTSNPSATPTKPTAHIRHKLLGPQPFPLERMLAIFRAIVPDDDGGDDHNGRRAGRGGKVPQSADLLTQVATLGRLGLVVRTGGDPLDLSGKWRVNVGWEYIRTAARGVGCEIENWVFE